MDDYLTYRLEQRREEMANVLRRSEEMIALATELCCVIQEITARNNALIEQTRVLIAKTQESLRRRPPMHQEIIGRPF